ncbi:DUF3099 domain-containing protein [Marisediminicola sp. LYQ134]|uniref:DUF3099 domain-containing protein n=1 Tax=Marisediminicola sp. LYQ134 TaxID=3391061 RepID=UPI003983678E
MAKQTVISSVTSLPKSPTDARRGRMRNYLIAMGIRLICIALCFVVTGWWLAVVAVGAIVLPYFAVVLANVGGEQAGTVERPGSIVPVARPVPPAPGPAE